MTSTNYQPTNLVSGAPDRLRVKMEKKNDLDVIAKIIGAHNNGRITVHEALQEMTEYAVKMALDLPER